MARKATAIVKASSNRTIVGLKPFAYFGSPAVVGSSNRTIVGLKLQALLHILRLSTRSNRTIVGLKHPSKPIAMAWASEQQSHHCGIETKAVGGCGSRLRMAAIAPLWD